MSTQNTPISKIYLNEIKSYPLLTREEEYELVRGVKKGDDQSKQRLILSNLRLVVKVARNYQNRGLNFEDLISEGNIGLIYAVEKFDPEKGFRFSTYAIWWIKQAIKKAIINKGRDIRIPSYKHDLLSKINNTSMKYITTYSRYPSIKEIAAEIGMEEAKIEEIFLEFQDMSSLNDVIGDELILEDVVLEKDSEFMEDKIIETIIGQEVKKTLEILDDREKEIIIARYGIGGDVKLTLEEVGKKFNITRERVRQIEKRALEKLRKEFKKEFKEYID